MANLVFNRPAAEWEAEGHDKELVDGLDHGAVLSRACLYQGTLMIDMKVPTLGNFECCITEETVLGYLDAGILPEVSLCCNSYLTIVLLCRVSYVKADVVSRLEKAKAQLGKPTQSKKIMMLEENFKT